MLSNFTNLYFPICSFVVTVLLLILYFSKKNVENKETYIYSKLIIVGFLESLLYCYICAVAHFLDIDSHLIFYEVLNKILYIIYIIWFGLLYNYEINISFTEDRKKIANIFMSILYIIEAVIVLLIIILPVDIYFDKATGLSNSSGASSIALFTGMALYVISIFIVGIINFKSKNAKKFTPLFLLIFLMVLTLIIRIIDPFFSIYSNVLSLVTLVMYFTIENPDLKMLNELNLAKLEAEKSSRAKSELISSMSHEIRTPINAIYGFSQLIELSETLDEAKENAKDIIKASNDLLTISSNIMDMSSLESKETKINNIKYDLYDEFNSIAELFKEKVESKKLILKTIITKKPKYLYGDISNIKKIVINILDNAVKFTEKGKIAFNVTFEKKHLNILIEDTGIGIKEEDLKNIFNSFEKTNETKNSDISGMGLGLTITKKLVDLLGGTIKIESEYGKYTKVIIKIKQEEIK